MLVLTRKAGQSIQLDLDNLDIEPLARDGIASGSIEVHVVACRAGRGLASGARHQSQSAAAKRPRRS
jgi:hypothetical protein